MPKREVRILLRPASFDGKEWAHREQPIVKLGEVGKWSMVRNAEHPQAAPFVISNKDWDRLPTQQDGG